MEDFEDEEECDVYYGWDFRLQKMVSLIAQFLDMQQRDIGGMGYQALLVVLRYSALNTRKSDPELTCDGRTIDPAWDTMIQPLLDAGADLNYQSNNDFIRARMPVAAGRFCNSELPPMPSMFFVYAAPKDGQQFKSRRA